MDQDDGRKFSLFQLVQLNFNDYNKIDCFFMPISINQKSELSLVSVESFYKTKS